MTIESIEEIENTELPKRKAIKETMDIYIPGIPEGVSRRNGMCWLLTGSGGSGKTDLLLNFFKSNKLYRGKFANIWLIVPEGSFNSIQKHPFADHDKVYHELNVGLLSSIYDQLLHIKETQEENTYSLIIIDDMANELKNKDIQTALATFIIKLRHLQCGMIFTLQSYFYMPKIVRKQITFMTMFKSKNWEEFLSIARELLGMTKEDCLILYKYVFDEKYNHLDMDLVENINYKNFNKLILHEKNID